MDGNATLDPPPISSSLPRPPRVASLSASPPARAHCGHGRARSPGAARTATTRTSSTPGSRSSPTIPCSFAICARRWARAA